VSDEHIPELLINLAMLDRFIGKIQTPGEGWETAAEDAAAAIRRIIAERDAARAVNAELLAACEHVVAVVDVLSEERPDGLYGLYRLGAPTMR